LLGGAAVFELLRGLFNLLGFLYWVLAIVVLAFVIYKGKKLWIKIVGAVIVIGLFGWLPVRQGIENYQRNAFAKEAWTYFKKLCDEKAGHKIHKTFTGVKSVVVLKPLPPATEKDLYDQYWYGDPYTNATPWSERGETAAIKLMGVVGFLGTVAGAPKGNQVGFQFVEYPSDEIGSSVYVLTLSKGETRRTKSEAGRPISRFGLSWEDISTPEDRKHWVAGSRLRVIDLTSQNIVAERIGYLIEPGFGSGGGTRRPLLNARGPRTTCPPLENGDYEDRWFVLKALIPNQGSQNGK
jgi:hypothetical protein